MTAAESISNLYNIIEKVAGASEARKAITTALSLILREINEEGLPMTSKSVEEKLENYVNDFIEVAQNTRSA